MILRWLAAIARPAIARLLYRSSRIFGWARGSDACAQGQSHCCGGCDPARPQALSCNLKLHPGHSIDPKAHAKEGNPTTCRFCYRKTLLDNVFSVRFTIESISSQSEPVRSGTPTVPMAERPR